MCPDYNRSELTLNDGIDPVSNTPVYCISVYRSLVYRLSVHRFTCSWYCVTSRLAVSTSYLYALARLKPWSIIIPVSGSLKRYHLFTSLRVSLCSYVMNYESLLYLSACSVYLLFSLCNLSRPRFIGVSVMESTLGHVRFHCSVQLVLSELHYCLTILDLHFGLDNEQLVLVLHVLLCVPFERQRAAKCRGYAVWRRIIHWWRLGPCIGGIGWKMDCLRGCAVMGGTTETLLVVMVLNVLSRLHNEILTWHCTCWSGSDGTRGMESIILPFVGGSFVLGSMATTGRRLKIV